MAELVADNIQDLLFERFNGQCAGYKQDYLDQELTNLETRLLICTICGGLTKDAVLLAGKSSCNTCCNDSNLSQPNNEIRFSVLEVKVSCPLKGRGCVWGGTLSGAAQHLNECEYLRIACNLSCKAVLLQNQMEQHQINECLMREIKCGKCGKKVLAHDMDRHLNTCTAYQVQCPEGCGLKVRRDRINEHINNTCGLTRVGCPYIGCKLGLIARKDLQKHQQEENETHQQTIKNELSQHGEELERLKTRFSLLEVDQRYQNELLEEIKSENATFREIIEKQQSSINALNDKIFSLENIRIHYNLLDKYYAKLAQFGKLENSDLKVLPKLDWRLDVTSIKTGWKQKGTFSQFGYELMCKATFNPGYFYNHIEIALRRAMGTDGMIKPELPLFYFSIQLVNRKDEKDSLTRAEKTDISIKDDCYTAMTDFPISAINSPDFNLNNVIIVRIQLLPTSIDCGIGMENIQRKANLDSVL